MSTRTREQAFADFPSAFRGEVLRASDEAYDDARRLFNARHAGNRPALIARCTDEDDVALAASYASNKGTPIAVRGGGHGVDGTGMPDDAFVIDLSGLRAIEVDPTRRIARAAGGVLLGEFDAATQEHGLATTAGTVTTTGLGGLTLGGGVGYLMRRFGATVDNLLSCEVVTVDGRRVRASEDENPDLFWGLRGAGHNFGITTSFEFRVHPVGPEIVNGLVVFPFEQAPEIFARLDDFMASAPRELMIHVILLPVPPLPGLPPETHGTLGTVFIVTYTGDLDNADAVVDSVLALGASLGNTVRRSTYLATNSFLDILAAQGRRTFDRGGYVSSLSHEMVSAAVECMNERPTPSSPGPSAAVVFWAMGGALDDVAEDAMAFSREGAAWLWEVLAQWDDPERDPEFESWVDESLAKLDPFSGRNGYVNLSVHRGPEWVRNLYGSPAKWQRLREIKAAWDPDNLLRYNKNIEPAS
jgi:FAD/FMN-containing dehydrogenase